MGNNPVIRFPSPAANATRDSLVEVSAPAPQRRIIRQPVPLPLPRSQRSSPHPIGPTNESAFDEAVLHRDTPWLRATGGRAAGQPCRRSASPATRGAFELDVSADFYATKADDLPPALFGYWLPRCCQIPSSRHVGTAPFEVSEVLGYNDPGKPQPPSILGYWPFNRPQLAEG